MSIYVDIALPVPIRELFTYKVPDDPLYSDLIGKRALVPFGTRYLTGVIIQFNENPKDVNIKPVLEILDEKRLFSDKLLKLTQWVSEYYFCSWGEVLKAAMPPNFNLASIQKIELLRVPNPFELNQIRKKAPKRAKLLQLLIEKDGIAPINFLQKELDNKNLSPLLEALAQQDFIRIVTEIPKQTTPKIKAVRLNPNLNINSEEFFDLFQKLEKSAPKQAFILSYIISLINEEKDEIILSELIANLNTDYSTITKLADKQLLEIIEIPKPIKSNNFTNLSQNEYNITFTEEQEQVISDISKLLDENKYSSHLLYGVTGSGKTLIYINLMKKVIQSGKQVLYLLPEISLTPQIVDRVKNFFGNKVGVIHSKINDNERNKLYNSINNNEFDIIMGVRSAIFAPLNNLGLIIVDEEHDSSYKQDNPAPRYNARDTAIVRAKIENIPVVLGSATPSCESWFNAKNSIYSFHKLTQRAVNVSLPDIKIVDLREEKRNKTLIGNFSSILLDKIIDRITKKEGVILFHNRRGFAPQLYCTDCGNVPMCENCDISLTYHKKSNKLVCHYCGYVIPAFNICNVCGSDDLKEIGAGTERIEEELSNILKDRNIVAKIQRFDRDSTSSVNASRKIMYNFINGDIDVLVGTQMLSKGIDIPRVTLVGVINADMHLFFPDFRANERTFQLLTQVAGRAGRKSNMKGEVIIQTSHPFAEPIQYAASQEIEKYFEYEFQIRKSAGYPPFNRLSKVEFLYSDMKVLNEFVNLFYSILPKTQKGVKYIGPVIPNIARISGNFREIIFFKSSKAIDKSGRLLNSIISNTLIKLSNHPAINKIRINVDIDSYQNM